MPACGQARDGGGGGPHPGLSRPTEGGMAEPREEIRTAGLGPAAEAAPPPKAKPVGGLRLLFLALWDRLRRLFRRS